MDDSIVPSTPTLFVPRRNDGFAEAVSSPQLPPQRFIFSSPGDTTTHSGPGKKIIGFIICYSLCFILGMV